MRFLLVGQFVLFADDEILMLPDKGGLLFLAQPLAVLSLLSSILGGPSRFPLASFVALSPDTILDGTHPVQDQLVDLFDHVKDTQLMLQVYPVALQTVFIQRLSTRQLDPTAESEISPLVVEVFEYIV
jgi:hypothetical protein